MQNALLISELHRRVYRHDVALRDAFSLKREPIAEFYRNHLRSLSMANFINRMDAVDDWTFDYNELDREDAAVVAEFIDSLETIIRENEQKLHAALAQLTKVLARITSSRCVYLLHYLSQRSDQFLPLFIQYVDSSHKDSVESLSVLKRLLAFYRANLIGEIFSQQRLSLIKSILGAHSDD